MDIDITRRQALLIGGGSIAGFGGLGLGARHIFRSADAPELRLPTARLEDDGWEQVAKASDEFESGSVGPFSLAWQTNSFEYHHIDEFERLEQTEATLTTDEEESEVSLEDAVTFPLGLFTATVFSVSPQAFDFPGGQVKNQVEAAGQAEALTQTIDRLEAHGFEVERNDNEDSPPDEEEGDEDSAQPGETMETNRGYEATVLEFDIAYPLEEVTLQTASGEELLIESETIPAVCRIAFWQPRSYLVSVAGTYPADDTPVALTGELADESVQLSADFALSPAERKALLDEYIRTIRIT